jgi:diguanylate cyclase (GGDEF)-like protein
MLDIDKFKAINDIYGHLIGDMVLTTIANAFTSLTRENDVVVRYGGEEFIIIFSNTKMIKNSQ